MYSSIQTPLVETIQNLSLKRKRVDVDISDISTEWKMPERACFTKLKRDDNVERVPEEISTWRVRLELTPLRRKRVKCVDGYWFQQQGPYPWVQVVPGTRYIPTVKRLKYNPLLRYHNMVRWHPKDPFNITSFLSANVPKRYKIFVNARHVLKPGFQILFHATDTRENALNILRNGFDPARIAPNCSFGPAYYFSPWLEVITSYGSVVVACAVYKPIYHGFGVITCVDKRQCIPIGLLYPQKK
jgi:hypothetical protein